MRILAVDFGKAKIGLAISSGDLASPYGNLDAKSEQKALLNLARICESEKIEKIIFGLPKPDLIGAKKFALKFGKLVNIPVIFIDEVMSSEMAKIKLLENGERHLKNKTHKVAAAIILQEYLDYK